MQPVKVVINTEWNIMLIKVHIMVSLLGLKEILDSVARFQWTPNLIQAPHSLKAVSLTTVNYDRSSNTVKCHYLDAIVTAVSVTYNVDCRLGRRYASIDASINSSDFCVEVLVANVRT